MIFFRAGFEFLTSFREQPLRRRTQRSAPGPSLGPRRRSQREGGTSSEAAGGRETGQGGEVHPQVQLQGDISIAATFCGKRQF